MKNFKKTLLAMGLIMAVMTAENATGADNLTTGKLKGIQVAPVLGMTSFALKGDTDSGYKAGISAGAMTYFPSQISSVDYEVGLEYLQAGGKDNYFFFSTTYELDYLSAPLGLRWKAFNYGQNAENFFFVRAGLAPSYLISSKVKVESIFSNSQEGSIETNSLDLMGYLSLGGTYAVGDQQHILYDVRYMKGTQSATKNNNNTNTGLIASVMYSFTL